MRSLLLILALVLPQANTLAQVEPFEGTWYLVYVEPDTGDPPATYVDPIEPPINPYLTINDDWSFEGEIACNTYTGQFDYLGFFGVDTLELVEFDHTNTVCEYTEHNDFEFLMFNLYWQPPFEQIYEIFLTDSGNAMILLFNFGFEQYYQGMPLNTEEFSLNEVIVFPNPVSELLKIKGNIPANAQITINNLAGVQITLPFNPAGSYNISDLASGVYFLTITTDKERQTFRFIKQ